MRRLTPEHKQQARSNQRQAVRVASVSGFAAIGMAAIPGVGPLLALAPGAVAALYAMRAAAQGDLVLDPPRDDFREPSRVANSTLRMDVLRESPLGSNAEPLVSSLDEATRVLSAAVVAIERSAGADLAGDLDAASEREFEAYEWIGRAGDQFAASAGAAVTFAEALVEHRDVPLPRPLLVQTVSVVNPGLVGRLLPPRTRGYLTAMGVDSSIPEMPRPSVRDVASRRPVERAISALRNVADADGSYSRFLHSAVQERRLFEGRGELAT